jgi:hypothetical protein
VQAREVQQGLQKIESQRTDLLTKNSSTRALTINQAKKELSNFVTVGYRQFPLAFLNLNSNPLACS